jgi:hypothetical protein
LCRLDDPSDGEEQCLPSDSSPRESARFEPIASGVDQSTLSGTNI